MARGRATDSDALVRAAARVFETKGYRNATIDDIAEAAGVSRPTVYKYTQSKRSLLDSMVDFVLSTIDERLREVHESGEAPDRRLRQLVEIHVEAATSMHAFYAILFSEQTELSDTARARFHDFSHQVAVDFRGLLDECVATAPAGARKIDTWIAANLILSMLTTLYRWYDPDGPTDRDELGRQIMLLLGAVVPKQTRRRATRTS